MARANSRSIRFDFQPGRQLAGKYEVIDLLGDGWEGEVYRVREITTGIDRAAKFFYPARNVNDKTLKFYAKKLNILRKCSIFVPYLTHDQIRHRNRVVKFLVSEFVEGLILKEFISKQPGQRLTVFEGLHLLYALTAGLEEAHALRDYHGDLHDGNIIISRQGTGFDVKLIDIYRWKGPNSDSIHEDVFDVIKIFYSAIGGRKHYARHRPEIKEICCGLKRSLILKKFRSAGQLRRYLENLEWYGP